MEPSSDVRPDEGRTARVPGDPPLQAALPGWKRADALTVQRERGLAAETDRGRLGRSALTPAEELFVCQHNPFPDPGVLADPDAWTLEVSGVAHPRTLTLGELRRFEEHRCTAVLQCSGNGRAFFPHETQESRIPDWTVGAVANLRWTGVRVREVIAALGGPLPDGAYLTVTGGEPLPEGSSRDEAVMERSVPLDKGLEDCLLAWELDGGPIPLEHGGPLRLVVPGYYGVNSVKWAHRLAVTREQTDVRMQRHSYRVRPIGRPGSPEYPSMWSMAVKSFVTSPVPGARLEAGSVTVEGVAFGGEAPPARVEVSADGGRSWRDTAFVDFPDSPYAWRRFGITLELPAGVHVLCTRATDTHGSAQPETRVENERGYANTSWRDHAVTVHVEDRS